MEKPKKLDKFEDMDSRDKGYQAGYNNCIDDYEKFLPGEDEIRETIDSRLDCPACDNSGRTMPDGDQCEFCYREENSKFNLAKAIAKRAGRSKENG